MSVCINYAELCTFYAVFPKNRHVSNLPNRVRLVISNVSNLFFFSFLSLSLSLRLVSSSSLCCILWHPFNHLHQSLASILSFLPFCPSADFPAANDLHVSPSGEQLTRHRSVLKKRALAFFLFRTDRPLVTVSHLTLDLVTWSRGSIDPFVISSSIYLSVHWLHLIGTDSTIFNLGSAMKSFAFLSVLCMLLLLGPVTAWSYDEGRLARRGIVARQDGRISISPLFFLQSVFNPYRYHSSRSSNHR